MEAGAPPPAGFSVAGGGDLAPHDFSAQSAFTVATAGTYARLM